jgi:uncharacterized RDD family membrane protein YckC
MTCQYCQTWNPEEEHRCRRCGRRISAVSPRISPGTYPIAATARALALDTSAASALDVMPLRDKRPEPQPAKPVASPQPLLFDTPTDSRVVSVDSLRSPIEREAVRARAAEFSRPAPPNVEVSPRQNRRPVAPRQPKPRDTGYQNQQRFDFTHQQVSKPAPNQTIVCDAPVAPVGMRIHAGSIDGLVMLAGCIAAFVPVRYFAGPLSFDKYTGLLLAVLFAVVALSYRLVWIMASKDSIGMQLARVSLVDFDGRPPKVAARYHRLGGSLISVLPAGLGLLWAFVDEEGLMWQDHISSTFPSVAD